MNLNVKYFDNKIVFNKEFINVLEIENKKYFYRFIKDLYSISSNNTTEDIHFFENEKEINMSNKLRIYVDFFDFQFDSKKYVNDISKYVSTNISEDDKNSLVTLYNKMVKQYSKILNNVEVPLQIESEFSVDNLNKLMRLSINAKEDLLDNMLLLIDLEKTLKLNNLLVFVNLKQYLSKDELSELYKYSIYNEVIIFLVDSQSYGVCLKYEKKHIIDENLDEFML